MSPAGAARWSSVMLAVALLATPARAHHGNLVAFDLTRLWTRTAVVARFRYVNPHPALEVDVSNDGVTERWSTELLSTPGSLARRGWSKERSDGVLAPGTMVLLTVAPSKSGESVGLVLSIVDAHGAAIVTDGVPLVVPVPAAADRRGV